MPILPIQKNVMTPPDFLPEETNKIRKHTIEVYCDRTLDTATIINICDRPMEPLFIGDGGARTPRCVNTQVPGDWITCMISQDISALIILEQYEIDQTTYCRILPAEMKVCVQRP